MRQTILSLFFLTASLAMDHQYFDVFKQQGVSEGIKNLYLINEFELTNRFECLKKCSFLEPCESVLIISQTNARLIICSLLNVTSLDSFSDVKSNFYVKRRSLIQNRSVPLQTGSVTCAPTSNYQSPNGSFSYILDSQSISNLNGLIGMTLSGTNFNLLYRASRDGFNAANFHTKCDNHGPTLTLIRSECNYIFGGYASKPWYPSRNFYSDSYAFIFSLNRSAKLFVRLARYALYSDPAFGPNFGYDITITDQVDQQSTSFCELGDTYDLPAGHTFGTNSTREFLAGSFFFKVLEIEVFKKIR